MLKVLYFHTYPPFCTSGHLSGYRVTRMDTSDCSPLVHNTHIYKYNFHLDIYICMLVGVFCFLCFQVCLSVLEIWWVLWSDMAQHQCSCGIWHTHYKWVSSQIGGPVTKPSGPVSPNL
jgi:hypothetical protein